MKSWNELWNESVWGLFPDILFFEVCGLVADDTKEQKEVKNQSDS